MPTESPISARGTREVGVDHAAAPAPQPRVALCPYCGEEIGSVAQCPRCKGLTDPLSRQASQNAMGPWTVRDEDSPFRPGFSFDTLRAMIARGRVQAETVLRGPGTKQFWMRASGVPGVANLLGVCHACQGAASASDTSCRACGARFEVETDRQFLGLSPVRLLPGHASAEQIAASSMVAPREESPRRKVPAPVPERAARVPEPAGQVGAPPAMVSATAAEAPRGVDSARGWRMAAVVLSLVCVALIGAIVVTVFLFPAIVDEIRAATNMNK